MKFTTIGQAKKETTLSYLGGVNTSAKISKNGKLGIKTYVIYFAPDKTSGYNVCPFSTVECRLGCLNTSGRSGMEVIAGFDKIRKSRVAKTRLFHEQKDFFMDWMIAEISAHKTKAENSGFEFSIRLNGTSDIDWKHVYHNGKNIFQYFPTVQFYDYTKDIRKFDNISPNYHLTYSYTGRNWDNCVKVLNMGYNVAVVFNIKKNVQLPDTFNGYPVCDGDITDYRPFDPKNSIVGLRWKKIGDKNLNDYVKNSIFVVQV